MKPCLSDFSTPRETRLDGSEASGSGIVDVRCVVDDELFDRLERRARWLFLLWRERGYA